MEDAAAAALLAEEAAEEFQPKSPQSALSGHADGYQKGDGASLRSAGSFRKRSEVNNSAIDVKVVVVAIIEVVLLIFIVPEMTPSQIRIGSGSEILFRSTLS